MDSPHFTCQGDVRVNGFGVAVLNPRERDALGVHCFMETAYERVGTADAIFDDLMGEAMEQNPRMVAHEDEVLEKVRWLKSRGRL